MGTRSYIAKDIGEGKFLTILCQLESHLEYTGALLINHYNTPDKVDALLGLGDIYYLGERLEPDPALPHGRNSGNYQENVTIAFGRDRGKGVWPAQKMTFSDMEDNDEMVEFIYVFTPQQEWIYCCPTAPDLKWRSVRKGLDTGMEYAIYFQDAEEPDCDEENNPVLSI